MNTDPSGEQAECLSGLDPFVDQKCSCYPQPLFDLCKESLTNPSVVTEWTYCDGLWLSDMISEGCCGPDATKWLYHEFVNNYNYASGDFTDAPLPPELDAISRYLEAIRFEYEGQTIGVENVKLALYGLIVDYGYIDYQLMEMSSRMNSGESKETPAYSCGASSIISVCGVCQDATDYGNFILGIAIFAAGADRQIASLAGKLFNILSEDTSAEADTFGVEIGYDFAASGGVQPSYNRQQFCNALIATGTQWHDPLPNSCVSRIPCNQDIANLDNACNSTVAMDMFVSSTVVGGQERIYANPVDELYKRLAPFILKRIG